MTSPLDIPRTRRRFRPSWIVGPLALLIGIVLPFVNVPALGILPGSTVNAPGSLLFVAAAFAFAGAAMSYDIVFGFAGLLSLGHSLFFGGGVYLFAISQEVFHLDMWLSMLVALVFIGMLAFIVGVPTLRVNGFAFAMVTLALASAGSVIVIQDPFNITGGDVGLTLSGDGLPEWLRGIKDARNVYWLALVVMLVIFVIAWFATRSPAGHVWEAVRENEGRVRILGLRTLDYKLGAWVLSAVLAALAGVVYAIVFSGANIFVASVECAIAIQIIVILGGVGRLWGSIVGAFIYVFASNRLPDIVSSSDIPQPWGGVLSQPLLPLGIVFIVFVLWAPGGIAGLVEGRGRRQGSGGLAQPTGATP